MKRPSLRFSLTKLLVFMAVVAVVTFVGSSWSKSRYLSSLPNELREPIKALPVTYQENGLSNLKYYSDGETWAESRHYDLDGFRIIEIGGGVRIATRSKNTGSAKGGSLICVARKAPPFRTDHWFSKSGCLEVFQAEGGSRINFDGHEFSTVKCEIKLKGGSFSVNGPPALVIVSASGEIEKVFSLTLQ